MEKINSYSFYRLTADSRLLSALKRFCLELQPSFTPLYVSSSNKHWKTVLVQSCQENGKTGYEKLFETLPRHVHQEATPKEVDIHCEPVGKRR